MSKKEHKQLETLKEYIDQTRKDMESDLHDATILEGGDPSLAQVSSSDAADYLESHGNGDERSTHDIKNIAPLFKQ